jgi:hypothetical protein
VILGALICWYAIARRKVSGNAKADVSMAQADPPKSLEPYSYSNDEGSSSPMYEEIPALYIEPTPMSPAAAVAVAVAAAATEGFDYAAVARAHSRAGTAAAIARARDRAATAEGPPEVYELPGLQEPKLYAMPDLGQEGINGVPGLGQGDGYLVPSVELTSSDPPSDLGEYLDVQMTLETGNTAALVDGETYEGFDVTLTDGVLSLQL